MIYHFAPDPLSIVRFNIFWGSKKARKWPIKCRRDTYWRQESTVGGKKGCGLPPCQWAPVGVEDFLEETHPIRQRAEACLCCLLGGGRVGMQRPTHCDKVGFNGKKAPYLQCVTLSMWYVQEEARAAGGAGPAGYQAVWVELFVLQLTRTFEINYLCPNSLASPNIYLFFRVCSNKKHQNL